MPDTIDLSKVTNIKFDGIDFSDYPDFYDAYITEAEYNGEKMTGDQIDDLNDNKDFVYEQLMNYLN